MLLNYETVIVGERCVLVPYRPQHVPTYHSWMQDPELLQATASEPLTLSEEHEMQATWRDDPNKCTYIVLARECCSFRRAVSSDGPGGGRAEKSPTIFGNHDVVDDDNDVYDEDQDDDDFVERNLQAMAGDVNLFLSQEEEDEGSADEGGDGGLPEGDMTTRAPTAAGTQAEIDIMIAEPAFRGRGLGREACALVIRYGAERLNVRRFFCKIHETNAASLRLFQSLGFTRCGYAECFREVELELRVDESSPNFTSAETESKSRTFTSRITQPGIPPSNVTTSCDNRITRSAP